MILSYDCNFVTNIGQREYHEGFHAINDHAVQPTKLKQVIQKPKQSALVQIWRNNENDKC